MMPEADRLGGDNALVDALKEQHLVLSNIPSQTNKNEPKKQVCHHWF
jgi:hypothetical protein